MPYDGIIIRPPSEADSLILQITIGCSHNRCSFCPAYKNTVFRIKTTNEIFRDIDAAAAATGGSVRRIFLCDGDPLVIPSATLSTILQKLNARFPRLQRVGMYANAGNIVHKSAAELRALREQKLGIVYMGLESGDQATLDRMQKGVTVDQMITAALMVREAGIKLSVTVILGLGGTERSQLHAIETMRVLNQMKPHHVGALTLMVVKGTPLYREWRDGSFNVPEPFGIIEELRLMIQESQLENCLFFSNHASNYLPLSVRLSRQKDEALRLLETVLKTKDADLLTQEYLRGL